MKKKFEKGESHVSCSQKKSVMVKVRLEICFKGDKLSETSNRTGRRDE